MTPFAAGCALCGADLDPTRWQKPASIGQRLTRLPQRWRLAGQSRKSKAPSKAPGGRVQ